MTLLLSILPAYSLSLFIISRYPQALVFVLALIISLSVMKRFEAIRATISRLQIYLRVMSNGQASSSSHMAPAPGLYFAGFCLDVASWHLTTPAGKRIPLSRRDIELLSLFLLSPAKTLSADDLMDVWGIASGTPSVRRAVAALERKIAPGLIRHIPGGGYQFTAEVQNVRPLPLTQEDREERADSALGKVKNPLSPFINRAFFILLLTVAFLPVWLLLQDLFPYLFTFLHWDRFLQQTTVPYELQYVSSLLSLLGFHIQRGNEYITWQTAPGKNDFIYFTWNCGGWQSLFLFLVSACFGLWGQFTSRSKWQALLIGLVATYLFSMLRLITVVAVYIWFGRLVGNAYHEVLIVLLTFGFLALFWAFAYRYVLTETDQPISPAPFHKFRRMVFSSGMLSILLIIALLTNYVVFYHGVPVAHAAGNPTIEQHINLSDTSFTSVSTLTGGNAGIALIDTANYTGATYYFEVDASISSSTGTVTLKYNAGTGSTVSGGSTINSPTISGATVARYRSASFSPTGAQNAYMSTIGANITVQAARIIVVQTAATGIQNSVTQIEIGNNESTTITSDQLLANPKYWTWDGTNYDGTVTVYLEATMLNGTSAKTTTVTLYETGGAGCNVAVTGSAVTMSGTTPSRVRSSDISANLTNGTSYQVCLKSTSPATATVINAKLVVQQTSAAGLTKMRLVQLSVNTPTTQNTSTYTSKSFLFQYNPSDWAGGTFTYYYGATLKAVVSSTTYSQLYNNTDSSAVNNSDISVSGSQISWEISSGLTMPGTSKDMDSQIKNNSTNISTVEGSWLIIDVTSLQTPENVLPFLPLSILLPVAIAYMHKRRRYVITP